MQNKHRICLSAVYLILCILFLPTITFGQRAESFSPPTWAVGDWWVVESQVFELGNIMSRPSEPQWSPRQGWRFKVEGIEQMAEQPYFIVSIHPLEANKCPYYFRYWFRSSDRYLGRHELFHPTRVAGGKRVVGPPSVRKDFPTAGAAPFLSMNFPALPISVPLFGVEKGPISFLPDGGKFEMIQETAGVDSVGMEEKTDPNFFRKIGSGRISKSNRLITMRTKSDLVERQYWSADLPWCVYGERVDGTVLSKRYWLTDMGKR